MEKGKISSFIRLRILKYYYTQIGYVIKQKKLHILNYYLYE